MRLIRQIWGKKNRTKRPAIFLDRDGTLIRHRDVVSKKSQMRPLPGVVKGLQKFQKRGYLLIVVSNQPNIEWGAVGLAATKELHKELRMLLRAKGVSLNAIYFCPHRFKTKCSCRKPAQGLIRAACKDFNIDMKKSWLIGDTTRDMETGRRAKLKTIRVATGDHGSDNKFFKTKGDFSVREVTAAAEIIVKLRTE